MQDQEAARLAEEVLAAIPEPSARLKYSEHWAEVFKLVPGLQEVGMAFMEAAREIRAGIARGQRE